MNFRIVLFKVIALSLLPDRYYPRAHEAWRMKFRTWFWSKMLSNEGLNMTINEGHA